MLVDGPSRVEANMRHSMGSLASAGQADRLLPVDNALRTVSRTSELAGGDMRRHISEQHQLLFETIDYLRDQIDAANEMGLEEASGALMSSLRLLLLRLDELPKQNTVNNFAERASPSSSDKADSCV